MKKREYHKKKIKIKSKNAHKMSSIHTKKYFAQNRLNNEL